MSAISVLTETIVDLSQKLQESNRVVINLSDTIMRLVEENKQLKKEIKELKLNK